MSRVLWMSILVIGVLAIGCRVEKTEEGRMPSVDVDPGALPNYEVETPDIDVELEERTITVPRIEVTMPSERDAQPQQEPSPAAPPAETGTAAP